ncbi:MFS transporter [Caulobacter ginsengisoli]|uniref:MFS transporter n=1 Tax=Caulobacter ginsengisoli TaxID=400775 RepID=UPI0027D7EC6C|nr:MFS transporter [Caulobacter ginsengisoli]
MATGRRSTLTLAAFAAPCLPLAAFGLPLTITLPTFYAESLGLGLELTGWAWVLIRLFDIAFDPLFGTVLDRTNWKWGRFKSWFAIGTPILMLAVWMLFMAKPGVGPIHLFFWLGVVYIGYSITVLSHTSWASTLSADYHQRSRVYAFWQTGNVVGMILILAMPVLLGILKVPGREDGYVGQQGLFIVIMAPLMIALALWRVEEPKVVHDASAPRTQVMDYFKMLSRPTVRRVLIADLLMGLAPGVAGTLFFFYFIRVKGFDRIEAAGLLLIYFLAAIVGAVLWTRLAKRSGKASSLRISCVIYAAVQFLVVFLPAGNFLMAVPFLVLAGLPYSAASFLLRSMMADINDEERLNTGKDRTGMLFSILTGTQKVGSALAGSSFILLSYLGLNAENPAASTAFGLLSLQAMYAVVPGVIGLLAALTMVGYPLTEERHAEIRQKLGERDATHPPPPQEDTVPLDVAPAQ